MKSTLARIKLWTLAALAVAGSLPAQAQATNLAVAQATKLAIVQAQAEATRAVVVGLVAKSTADTENRADIITMATSIMKGPDGGGSERLLHWRSVPYWRLFHAIILLYM